jgi:hypothetical protein
VVRAEVVVCDGAYEDARGVYVALEEGTFENPKGAKLTAGEKGVWGLVVGGEVVARGKRAGGVPWDEAMHMEGADWVQERVGAPLSFEGASST